MNDQALRELLEEASTPRPEPEFVDRLERRLTAELDGSFGRTMSLPGRLAFVAAIAFVFVVLSLATRLADESPSITEVLDAPDATTTPTSLPTAPDPSVTQPAEIEAPGGAPREIFGALPDGTPFDITTIEPPAVVEVTAINATILRDNDDGTSKVVGESVFRHRANSQDDISFVAGDWIVGVDVSDQTRAELGPQWADEIRDHVTETELNGYPVLELASPLRWARDDEVEVPMEVVYDDFVVRRGCGELASRCSESGAVQLIPIDLVRSGTPPSDLGVVWLSSTASRPPESFVDPGLLRPRLGAIVQWTGSEMLVYGGHGGDLVGRLTDGALYDPVEESWRTIPDAPDGTGSANGVWVGERLLVVSDEATMAFSPVSMSWSRIADGVPGVTEVVFDGDRLVAWGRGTFALTLDTVTWTDLGEIAPEADEDDWRVLRSGDGTVYAIAMERACAGFSMWQLSGDSWIRLPDQSIGTAEYAQCNLPQDSATLAGDLVIWQDDSLPAALFDAATETWTVIDSPPIGGCDGGTSSARIGDRLLVGSCGEAAILDPVDLSWRPVALPGAMDHDSAVWTGEELLMWRNSWPGIEPDPWRWTPPG